MMIKYNKMKRGRDLKCSIYPGGVMFSFLLLPYSILLSLVIPFTQQLLIHELISLTNIVFYLTHLFTFLYLKLYTYRYINR